MDSILNILLICVAGWILIRYLLIPVIRFLFHFIKRLLLSLPFWLIAFFIPSFIDEGVILSVVAFLAIVDCFDSGFRLTNHLSSDNYSSDYASSDDYTSDHYVLNKKSKVAHKSTDPSADTISYNHRKDVFASKSELIDKGYRIKK